MLADVPLATNALVLLAVLAVTTVVWLVLRRRDGAFRPADGARDPSGSGSGSGDRTGSAVHVVPADLGLPQDSWRAAVTAGVVGSRGTFVQVSSEGCATCPQVARMLSGLVADGAVADCVPDGVVHVEVDAADRLDLVRRLGILRTPTVLLVDGDGRLVSRTSGTVRADQARAALAGLSDGAGTGAPDLVPSGDVR